MYLDVEKLCKLEVYYYVAAVDFKPLLRLEEVNVELLLKELLAILCLNWPFLF